MAALASNGPDLLKYMSFREMVDRQEIKLDACSVAPYVLNHSLLNPKRSASLTEVAFATLYDQAADREVLPVAIKYSVELTDEDLGDIEHKLGEDAKRRVQTRVLADLAGLEYEIRVYRKISTVLSARVCPNFIGFVGHGLCNWIDQAVQTAGPNELLINKLTSQIAEEIRISNNLRLSLKKFLRGKRVNVLMTFRPLDVTSFSAWRKAREERAREGERLNKAEELQVLFQLIYALHVMETLRLSHNDLHTGNILIQTLAQPVTLTYRIYGTVYQVTTRFIAYVYDWDFAVCDELGQNLKVTQQWCREQCVAMEFRSKYDLFFLACSMGFKTDLGALFAVRDVRSEEVV